MTLSTTATAAAQRTSDGQGFLDLLTLTGGGIAEPMRLVNDTREVTSQGQLFQIARFEIVLPKEAAKEVPRAQLRIDNVGREIGQELEALPPGAELTARFQRAYRVTPDVIEYEFTAPLSGVRANVFTVSAVMGPTDLMRRAAVNARFDPYSAPGLFPD